MYFRSVEGFSVPTWVKKVEMLVRGAKLLLVAVFLAVSISVSGQERSSSPQSASKLTDDQLKETVAPMRAGRSLSPATWPNGTKVAVCLTWDMDDESPTLVAGSSEPIALSWGEYGARDGLRRIMALYDRYNIPGTFYIPAAVGVLHPELVEELKKHPRHEVGIHGWIHENVMELNNRAEEERLLRKAVEFWTQALGTKPVGYRAPFWTFSPYTLDLVKKLGFEYDSSAMSMDEPYEINSHGQPTGLVELPVNWILDDWPYLGVPGGTLPSPELTFKVYQDDFDQAYEERTLFILTMHPMISGRRSNMVFLDRLVAHMKSKPGVWFATARQVAEYAKRQSGMKR